MSIIPDIENWLPLVGSDKHQVSDLGRIRTNDGVFLKPRKYREGKEIVSLNHPTGPANKSVHHAVLEAFVGLKPKGYRAKHANGDVADNRLVNLSWAATLHTEMIQGRADPDRVRKKPGTLTAAQIAWARTQHKPYTRDAGHNLRTLALALGVTEGALSRALAGKTHEGKEAARVVAVEA